MKKLSLLILIVFLLPNISEAQSEVFSRTAVVSLDSNVTQYLWIPFYAPRAGEFSITDPSTKYKYTDLNAFASTVVPKFPAGVFNDGNLVVFMCLDTVAGAVESSDSLVTWAMRINAQGKMFGDTLDLDWSTSHAVLQSATKYINMLDWTMQAEQADTNRVYYWVDLTSEYEACAGILFAFEQYAAGTKNGTRNRARIATQEVR